MKGAGYMASRVSDFGQLSSEMVDGDEMNRNPRDAARGYSRLRSRRVLLLCMLLLCCLDEGTGLRYVCLRIIVVWLTPRVEEVFTGWSHAAVHGGLRR